MRDKKSRVAHESAFKAESEREAHRIAHERLTVRDENAALGRLRSVKRSWVSGAADVVLASPTHETSRVRVENQATRQIPEPLFWR